MRTAKENIFSFGKFRLDAANKVLRCGDEIVALPLKSVELICLLVENSGEVVGKQEIFEKIWADSFVEDSVLTQNIYTLRKAFENLGEKNLIKTVPRRGYIFNYENETETAFIVEREIYEEIEIVETENAPEAVLALPPAKNANNNKKIWFGTTAAILLAALGAFAVWRYSQPAPKPTFADVKSIAVLPLKVFDAGGDEENLRLRLMDSLITKLGKIETISVRPTSATMTFLESRESSLEIGRKLQVDAIFEGAVQREAKRIRVTLQLVSVKTGEQIWAEQFDGEAARLLDLQNAVSVKFSDDLNLPLSDEQKIAFAARPTMNAEAFEEYLKGRYFWQKRTPEALQSAIKSFEKAVALDQNFALAHAGLADVYCILPEYADADEAESYRMAQTHAERALEIDADFAEALTALAFVEFWKDKNFAAAEKHFRRAIAVNPNYPTARHWFANTLLAKKNLPEAVEQMQAARSLDPLSLVINTELGILHYYSREYDLAAAQLRRTLAAEPNFHRAALWLGRVLTMQKEYAQALAQYKTIPAEIARLDGYSSEIALTNALSGNRAQAENSLRELKARSASEKTSFSSAIICLGLNEKEKAVEFLKKAVGERESDLAYVDTDPVFDPLRENAEFQRLSERFR